MNKSNTPFNCSHQHEINHISAMYLEQEKVRDLLENTCETQGICQWTTGRVHQWLQEQGFNRIK